MLVYSVGYCNIILCLTNQPKETMKKEIITILKTAINLIEEKNDLDFVLFFINKSFKKMGVK